MMSKHFKWFSRTLAVVLTVLLTIEVVPFQAFAQEEDPAAKTFDAKHMTLLSGDDPFVPTSKDSPQLSAEEPQSLIIGEDVSLRGENVKYFRCKDGRYLAAMYSTPVHYLKDGAWRDIDNTLVADGGGFETTEAGLPVSIPSDIAEEKLEVGNGEHTIGFGLVTENTEPGSAAKVVAAADAPALMPQAVIEKSITERNAEIMNLKRLEASVLYANLLSATDFEYTVSPNKIKESIIVKQPQEKYVYQFSLDLDGLLPVPQADGSIWLVENSTDAIPAMRIEAPFMIDAAEAVSGEVSMEISDDVLTVTADAAWINAAGRAFPIKIDPTLDVRPNATTIRSATVATGSQVQNDLYPGVLMVGNFTGRGKGRAFIQFDLPILPDCSVLSNAWIQLQNGGDYGEAETRIKARKADGAWTTGGVTWANQPTASGITLDYQSFDDDGNQNANNLYRWNITAAAKGWYENGEANNGISLFSDNENWECRVYLNKPETMTGGVPPLILEYINNTGLESNWSYETFDLGRSGSVNVNDYSGSLVYVHPDIAMDGNRLPIGFDHVYSSDRLNFSGNFAGMKLGIGFRLSLLEQVIPITFSSDPLLYNNNYRFRYIDGDGTTHFFKLVSGKIQHEYDPTLTLNTAGTLMSDESGTKKTFNASGWLTKTEDANGNAQNITWSGDKITQVSDPVGRAVTFQYDANGLLTSITDPAGRVTAYKYSSDGRQLTAIVYPNDPNDIKDDVYTKFEYDELGTSARIRQIVSLDNKYLSFGYQKALTSSDQRIYRVTSVTEGGGAYATTIGGGSSGSGSFSRNSNWFLELLYQIGKFFLVDLFGMSLEKYDRLWNGGEVIVSGIIETLDDLLKRVFNISSTGSTVTLTYMPGETVVKDSTVSKRAQEYHLLFDNGGRVVATRDQDGRAGYTRYNGDGAVTKESSVQEYNNNLLKNSSGETNEGWTKFTETTASYPSSEVYIGNRSFMIQGTDINGYGVVSQQLQLTRGKTYTISAYIKIKNGDLATFSGGAYVGFYIPGASSEWTQSDYYMLPTDWTKISCSVTVPSGSGTMEVNAVLGLDYAAGSVYFDAVQLEEGAVSNRYNLLENSSFDDSNGQSIGAWTYQCYTWSDSGGDGNSATLTANDTSVPISGANRGAQISGAYNRRKRLRQEVAVKGKPGQTVVFGAWVNAANASGQAEAHPSGRRRFAISLTLKGATDQYTSIPFETEVRGRQFISGSYTFDQNVTSIIFYLDSVVTRFRAKAPSSGYGQQQGRTRNFSRIVLRCRATFLASKRHFRRGGASGKFHGQSRAALCDFSSEE